MTNAKTQALVPNRPAPANAIAPVNPKTVWRGIMGTIAEQCGPDVAQAMMENLAGVRVYVPKQYTAKGPLAKLSREQAEALISAFSSEIIYVPSALDNADIKEERFHEVERLVHAGVSTAEIANKLRVSQTYVFMLRREFGATPISEIRKRQKAALSAAE